MMKNVNIFDIFLNLFHFLLKIVEGLLLRFLWLIQIFVYKILYYPVYPLVYFLRKLIAFLKFTKRYVPLIYRDDISFSKIDKEYEFLKEYFLHQHDRYINFSGDSGKIINDLMKFKVPMMLFEYEKSYVGIVKHENIVGTYHHNYSCYYDKNETGKFDLDFKYFPGKRGDPGEGYKKCWYPQHNSWDNYPSLIQLEKHPICDKYYVAGDGNHRVMSSKIKDDAPPYVYAKISKLKWKLEGLFIFFICSFCFYEYEIEIIKSDIEHNSFIYLAIKETQYSSKIRLKIKIDQNGLILLDQNDFQNKLRFSSVFKTKLKNFPDPNWWVRSIFLNTNGTFPGSLN
jgi:hypothetical protein